MEDPAQKMIKIATYVFVAIILIWALWTVAEDAIGEVSNKFLVGVIIALVIGFAYFAQAKFKEITK